MPLQLVKMKFTATMFPVTRSLRNRTSLPVLIHQDPTSGIATPLDDCLDLGLAESFRANRSRRPSCHNKRPSDRDLTLQLAGHRTP